LLGGVVDRYPADGEHYGKDTAEPKCETESD
jgi:hypothetical protein